MKKQALGALWFLYGTFRIVMAVLFLVLSGTARLMAGALLTRVPHPLAWMSAFEALYLTLIAWSVVCAILGLIAAGMLLVEARPAQRLVTAAALVSMPEVPFGLVLGVYTLIVFARKPPES